MKVILLQDIKALGKKGDIREVSDGHARNFLLPKNMAVEASPKHLNDLKLKKAGEEKAAAKQLAAAEELASELLSKQVSLKMRAGEGGKLFGSISSKEIAAAYLEQHNMELDKKKIHLPEPIKSFGVHQVSIKLHPQVTGTLTVIVKET
ncbi:MAG: 50S ribosomal protein L9 [Lachnospiraceae bacterium]|jgi:large subunit ribosomal protein L9|nr:50S ribosomal protein L9 [Lachnospiraceae bacterium]